MSLDTPYTPQQALNNFRLFTELRPTDTRHEDIMDICHSILRRGIIGDDEHPVREIEEEKARRITLSRARLTLPT